MVTGSVDATSGVRASEGSQGWSLLALRPCPPAHVRQRALPHAPTGHLCRLQTQTTEDSGSLKDQPTPPDPDRGPGSKGKEPITWTQRTENFGICGQFRRNQRTDLSVLASGREKNQQELEVSKLLQASSPWEKAFGEQTRHFRFSSRATALCPATGRDRKSPLQRNSWKNVVFIMKIQLAASDFTSFCSVTPCVPPHPPPPTGGG